eukprot:3131355-Prymnesium_polylepis.1
MACVLYCLPALALGYHVTPGNPTEAEVVAHVNANVSATWRAEPSRRFAHVSLDGVKEMMGAVPPSPEELTKRRRADRATRVVVPPEQFDSRSRWKGCAHAIRDQGSCGSCWAFGAAETLSFRFCAAHNVSVSLSAQELLSCANTLNLGCKGGKPGDAFAYMESPGVHTTGCIPYSDGGGGSVSPCPSACVNASASAVKYKAKPWYAVSDPQAGWDRNADLIMAEVAANGPVEVTFLVYTDLLSYKSG